MNPLLVSGFGISIFVEKRKLVVQNRFKGERFEFYSGLRSLTYSIFILIKSYALAASLLLNIKTSSLGVKKALCTGIR